MSLARWAEHRTEDCGRPRAPSRCADEAWPIFGRAPGAATVASRVSARRYRICSFVLRPRVPARVVATRARTALVRRGESPACAGQARPGGEGTTSCGSVVPQRELILPEEVPVTGNLVEPSSCVSASRIAPKTGAVSHTIAVPFFHRGCASRCCSRSRQSQLRRRFDSRGDALRRSCLLPDVCLVQANDRVAAESDPT
jgi:hypothetical protein